LKTTPIPRPLRPALLFAWLATLLLCLPPGPLLGQQNESIRERGLLQACQFAYYPSDTLLRARIDFSRKNVRLRELVDLGQSFTKARLELLGEDGKSLASTDFPLADGKNTAPIELKTPKLDGKYQVRFTLEGKGEPVTVTHSLVRQVFPWEGNQLGISEEVPAPFEPVKAQAATVSVIGRKLTLNGLGLFGSIVSLDQELLHSPMTLRAQTADGKSLELTGGKVKLEENRPTFARYTGSGAGAGLEVKTLSLVEIDGMMRVEMTISPEKAPVALKALWLEIPIKKEQATLFHQYVDGARNNYAGSTPEGDGVVWTSKEAKRYSQWQNTFCPYLWLGGADRGIAWFAENDKGWLTLKGDHETPLQSIERSGDAVILKVHLVNHETEVKAPMNLVFGLQVSPTKPMAENWRKTILNTPSISGPVHPWGGIHCSARVPWNYDWSVVDKIAEIRRAGKADIAWFEAYAREHNPPKVYGVNPWIDRMKHFATRAAKQGMKPYLVYAEEMRASQPSPEWQTFQDEWGLLQFTNRQWATYEVFERGFEVNPSVRINFTDSYRDYGVYYMNEWLKRGAGLYWDNTYPQLSYDPIASDAYDAGDGQIQPALSFWNQRAYQKRVYNLVQYWKKNQDFDIEWSVHTTNAQLLPLQTWATVQLDLEFGRNDPFPPDFIRTESTGRQVGNMPFVLNPLFGRRNPLVEPLPKEKQARIDYGMAMVHETRPSGSTHRPTLDALNKQVYDAGYAEPGTSYLYYWDDAPALSVNNANVKWFSFVAAPRKEAVILLSSWNADETEVTLERAEAFRKLIGRVDKLVDAETGEVLASGDDAAWKVTLPAPYGMRLLKVIAQP